MGTQNHGGARRDRTADLLHAMQALSQLSYSPEKGPEFLVKSINKSTTSEKKTAGHLSRRFSLMQRFEVRNYLPFELFTTETRLEPPTVNPL